MDHSKLYVVKIKYEKIASPDTTWTACILCRDKNARDALDLLSSRMGQLRIEEQGIIGEIHSITPAASRMIANNYLESTGGDENV